MSAVEAPTGCPFCPALPERPAGPVLRPAVLRHADGCAIAQDAARQARADAGELADIARVGGANAAVVVRSLTSGERIALGAVRGLRPVPAALAEKVRVRVLDLGGGLLLRAVEHRGEVRSLTVVPVPGEVR